jgi:glycine/sarcosine N-methyltransferase
MSNAVGPPSGPSDNRRKAGESAETIGPTAGQPGEKNSVLQFYEGMVDEYHLMFADWRQEVRRQGAVLDGFIRSHLDAQAHTVLDCTCGIGTQAIGLATRGYSVHATDLSPAAVERARTEAKAFEVSMRFDVVDIRALETKVTAAFDVVIACDNAVSHFVSDTDLLRAASQMCARLRPHGLLLISIRDYDRVVEALSHQVSAADPGMPGVCSQSASGRSHATLPRVYDDADGRRIVFQVWDWAADERSYTVNQFFVQTKGENWHTSHHTARFRALLRAELSAILCEAGFVKIRWHMPETSGFYQPIVTARKG